MRAFKNFNGISSSDINLFILKAISLLDKKFSIVNFDTIIYPQSLSKINRKILETINDVVYNAKFESYELVKETSENIKFDYERYTEFLKNKGCIDKDILESLECVKDMMNSIHSKGEGYFKIGVDTKVKYRNYLENFFKFKNEEEERTFERMKNKNVLVIDDISTSHSTVNYILSKIRSINDTNNIVVFCLISNKL